MTNEEYMSLDLQEVWETLKSEKDKAIKKAQAKYRAYRAYKAEYKSSGKGKHRAKYKAAGKEVTRAYKAAGEASHAEYKAYKKYVESIPYSAALKAYAKLNKA